MENRNRAELSRWVEERTALLAPPADCEPDIEAARAHFAARLLERRRAPSQPWLVWVTAAASIACAIVLIHPATCALAQQLWQTLALRDIEVVRVEFESLPDEAKSLTLHPLGKPAPPSPAANAVEAAQRLGFVPRLPRAGVLSTSAQLSTLSPMSFGTVLRTADVELALRNAGVSDQGVPRQWDGAQLALHMGPTLTAEWIGITLMQGSPPVVVTPPGFDLSAFVTALLRSAGMDRENAHRFGRRMTATPYLLLGIGTEDRVTIREVKLRTGLATLIEDFGENGQTERITLAWSVPDRVYLLSGAITADLATAIANSIE